MRRGPAQTAALASAPRYVASLGTVLLLLAALTIGSGCRSTPSGPEGGTVRIALRAEPRTFNPVAAVDAVSASLVGLMHADLFTIDGQTQAVLPELAERLSGPDAQGELTLVLRRDVVFPDGVVFGAGDVVFTLDVMQDPAVGSPSLQALRVGGVRTQATAIDATTVRLKLGGVHPDPARLLAGMPILPRHRLEGAYREGRLADAWGLATAPNEIIGLGPFRLLEHVPGQRVVLGANQAYWKKDAAGRRLPNLSRVVAAIIGDTDQQTARLLAGDLDVMSAVDSRVFAVVGTATAASGLDLHDLGPSLEYTFLALNLDDPTNARSRARARWFHDTRVRQALSLAADRDAIARLVFDGRATPIATHVSPGNRRWFAGLAAPTRSLDQARELLRAAGYRWDARGRLSDPGGTTVAFTIVTSTSNAQRQRIATLLQADFDALGITVTLAALEFRSFVERVTRTREFDAAVMALGGGDADPIAEQGVWQRDGPTHVWRLRAPTAMAPWESEIDELMRRQAATPADDERRRLYARVQTLVAEQLPIVPLVSPNHLVVARRGLRGLAPGVTSRDSLWNLDTWSWVSGATR